MGKLQIAVMGAVFASTAPILSGSNAGRVPIQETVEAEVRATHAQMKLAAESLDAAALYAYVSDTSTPPIIEDGQLAPTRAAALERTTAGLRQLTKLSYTYARDNVTVLSANTALWVAEGTAAATLVDGRTINAPFAETIVFSRQNGRWKVLHAHRSAPNAQ
jgi:ketosteroid isomerase-like protein